MKSNFKKLNPQDLFIVFVTLVIPFFLVLTNLKFESINFWYDPSRDLLSAWDNLTKPTLLGPTTGISGLHYGPYWIWLLSFGLLFSKNPLIVTFITATIPYLIIFPLLWFRLSKYFDRTSLILGWLLFILGNGMTYATQLWNPYPAPLITLAMLVVLITADLTKINKKSLIAMFTTGILLALVVNFHISFGITLVLSVFLFLLVDTFMELRSKHKNSMIKTRLKLFCFIGIGLIVGFLPTIAFEFKHSFLQTHTLITTFLKFGNVVALKGLSRTDIFWEYFKTFSNILHVQYLLGMIIFGILVGTLIYKIKQKEITDYKDARIGLLSIIILLGSTIIYFTAKNPIWEYHFIGVDLAFLLFVTFAASKIPFFKKVLLVWTILIIIINFYTLGEEKHEGLPYLDQQEAIVSTIAKDAKSSDYSVYSYSQSIYMYDYAYLFRWLVNKKISYDPGFVKQGQVVYLIFPSKENAYIIDFTHNRAPEKKYYIAKTWHTEDITVTKNIKR